MYEVEMREWVGVGRWGRGEAEDRGGQTEKPGSWILMCHKSNLTGLFLGAVASCRPPEEQGSSSISLSFFVVRGSWFGGRGTISHLQFPCLSLSLSLPTPAPCQVVTSYT